MSVITDEARIKVSGCRERHSGSRFQGDLKDMQKELMT